MQVVKFKLDELIQHPRNVRVHGQKNLQALKKSLNEFGQTKPILVQKSTNYVIAGNGTLQAARALGWDEIECHVLDLDDNKANALAIMDNRTSDTSEWDEQGLTQLLKELNESQMLDLTGFGDEDLQAMLKFQEGKLFEEQKKKQKKEKKKQEIFENNYQEQLSFVLCNFAYVNADKEQNEQIRNLTKFLMDADNGIKQDVTKHIYDAIQDILTNQFMR